MIGLPISEVVNENNEKAAAPENLHQKFFPTLGLLYPSFCPGGFVGVAPEGRAFLYKQCLPFF